MKARVYLDPFVLACPSPEEGLHEFDLYITNIIGWSQLKNNDWISLCLPEQTTNVLFQSNKYPIWADLTTAIKALGIYDIQPQDVITLVNNLLRDVPSIESEVGISEILLNKVTCTPSEHLKNRLDVFVEHHQRILAFMSLVCSIFNVKEKEQVLITRQISDAYMEISVTGQVVDAQVEKPIASLQLPVDFRNDFGACSCISGLFLLLDPVYIWLNAENIEGFTKAIDVALHQALYYKGINEPDVNVYKWKMGPKLLDTAKKNGFLKQENKVKELLRACVEVILKENMRDTHGLRNGKGANAPQVCRGVDLAWRRDIDYEYHLHYWETASGPELAAIVVHNDMSIPS